MAKTIKFNLRCDDKPIRTLEDLQNNFSIEDILDYYENGLLQRWLKVRGYTKEFDEVSSITCKESVEIIKKLIAIFNVENDKKKVEESIYMLEYLNKRKELYNIYNKKNRQIQVNTIDYIRGYLQIINDILENPEDVARIKASIADMVQNYELLLPFHYRILFYELEQKSQLAVMCLLMNEELRKYYLPVITTSDDGKVSTDIDSANINSMDKKVMYSKICEMTSIIEFENNLGDNLHIYAGKTDGYWKDLEPKGKKCMILSMQQGDFVRDAGKTGGDMSYDDIHDQFVIVNGIDYKSNNATHKLLYMEV